MYAATTAAVNVSTKQEEWAWQTKAPQAAVDDSKGHTLSAQRVRKRHGERGNRKWAKKRESFSDDCPRRIALPL